jgi:hypothetical protein
LGQENGRQRERCNSTVAGSANAAGSVNAAGNLNAASSASRYSTSLWEFTAASFRPPPGIRSFSGNINRAPEIAVLVHKVFRTLLFVNGNGGEFKACLHHLIWALYRRCALHLEGNHNDAFKNGGMTHAEVQQCCKLFRSLAFASTVDDFVALLQNIDLLNKELSLERSM